MTEREILIAAAARMVAPGVGSSDAAPMEIRRAVFAARRLINMVDWSLKEFPTFEDFERREAEFQDRVEERIKKTKL